MNYFNAGLLCLVLANQESGFAKTFLAGMAVFAMILAGIDMFCKKGKQSCPP